MNKTLKQIGLGFFGALLLLTLGFVVEQTTGIYIKNLVPDEIKIKLRGASQTAPWVEIVDGNTKVFEIPASGIIPSQYLTGGGGGGNVQNTGTPASGALPYYSDTTGTNVAPSGVTVSGTNIVAGSLTANGNLLVGATNVAGALAGKQPLGDVLEAVCSDETTPLTAGTSKVTFRMPFAFTVTAVRASLTTAQASGSIFTVDINEGASSILSTKLTIDNTESTSTTAATPPVISDSALADDAVITVDIDQVGNGSATGLKVWIIGHQ